MINWEELEEKFPENREEMSEDREREYVNYCFDLYEAKEKMAETFWTPFEGYKEKEGQTFKVLWRVDESDCDLCALPMWHIALEDGTEIDAYPEEIFEREQKENGRKI